nr:MAG TPA: hypothetical protein [Caudoviricetes sp.]
MAKSFVSLQRVKDINSGQIYEKAARLKNFKD